MQNKSTFVLPSKETIDLLAQNSGGDIRTAINGLQFSCLKGEDTIIVLIIACIAADVFGVWKQRSQIQSFLDECAQHGSLYVNTNVVSGFIFLFVLFFILLFGCCLLIKVRRVADLECRLENSNKEREGNIKLCLLLCFKFCKTITLLLSVRRDFSVLFHEIIIGSNRIQSATCPWWQCFPNGSLLGKTKTN